MFRLESSLFHLAAQFTGKYAPFQGVTIEPFAGGVIAIASNRGAATFLGYDPKGYASEAACFLPGKELAAACKGIKSAERELAIEGPCAKVTTFYKEHSTAKEFTVNPCSQQPPIRQAVAEMLRTWGEVPKTSTTAGRYDLSLLTPAVRAIADESDCVVISGYDGGPLRLQSESLGCVVLLMPQTAQPIPPAPPWLADYAISA
jgi:hypothetical protein